MKDAKSFVFPTEHEMVDKYELLLISRNGWRLLALVQFAAIVAILINYYGFGVRA